jgi:hypothetical protein
MEETTTLYRPVGQHELDLIAASRYRAFPPRLPDQPIFYPVLHEAYATQIARDWNTKHNNPPVGYVTRFHVRTEYLDNYEVQVVGGSQHAEYWIPAEALGEFNRNIVGPIEVIAEFKSDIGRRIFETMEGQVDGATFRAELARRRPNDAVAAKRFSPAMTN